MALFLLLMFVTAGLVTGFALVGYGLSTLGRAGPRRTGLAGWFRCLAALLGAVAAATYTWGLIGVGFSALEAADGGTGSAPLPPCRVPGHPERARNVVDYSVGYMPLRFVCETKDGESYTPEAVVPHYVNPAALGFALAAAACTAAAVRTSEQRGRKGLTA